MRRPVQVQLHFRDDQQRVFGISNISYSTKFAVYFMGNGKLNEVNDFKLPGVTFSRDLLFDSHICF